MSAQRVSLAADGEDGIARLRLCAGERRNAIDPPFISELHDAVAALDGDARVRAVLVAADGPAFTVGGDLRHFAEHAEDLAGALADMVPSFHESLLALATLPVPVVAAVQGAAAGGGLGLAWAADVVIAAEDAVFATGFARLALTGDGGSSWWLPRLVGLRRAQELILRNRVLGAREALDWGLVTEVVAADELDARAETVAAELAAGPTDALGRMRALLRESGGRTLAEGYAAETAAMIEAGATPEAREGVTAFVERRDPAFAPRA